LWKKRARNRFSKRFLSPQEIRIVFCRVEPLVDIFRISRVKSFGASYFSCQSAREGRNCRRYTYRLYVCHKADRHFRNHRFWGPANPILNFFRRTASSFIRDNQVPIFCPLLSG
jgi:hypothetical protein